MFGMIFLLDDLREFTVVGEMNVARGIIINEREDELIGIRHSILENAASADDVNFVGARRIFCRFYGRFYRRDKEGSRRVVVGVPRDDDVRALWQGASLRRNRFPRLTAHDDGVAPRQVPETL